MTNDNTIKEVSEILGNKKKFRRALVVVCIMAAVICFVLFVGFYTHEISRIIESISK